MSATTSTASICPLLEPGQFHKQVDSVWKQLRTQRHIDQRFGGDHNLCSVLVNMKSERNIAMHSPFRPRLHIDELTEIVLRYCALYYEQQIAYADKDTSRHLKPRYRRQQRV